MLQCGWDGKQAEVVKDRETKTEGPTALIQLEANNYHELTLNKSFGFFMTCAGCSVSWQTNENIVVNAATY